MTIPDPSDRDSSHLGGIQPTWGDLPYACELIKPFYDRPDRPFSDTRDLLVDNGQETKVRQILNFLNKLDVVNEEYGLLPNGVWLAEAYQEPDQMTFESSMALGLKTELSPRESSVFKSILFDGNWLPMIATINQLATSSVSTKETSKRAEEFKDRLNHLAEYENYESINTWKKKAQTHFQWMEGLHLAETNKYDELQLTDSGEFLHQQLQSCYRANWPSSHRSE